MIFNFKSAQARHVPISVITKRQWFTMAWALSIFFGNRYVFLISVFSSLLQVYYLDRLRLQRVQRAKMTTAMTTPDTTLITISPPPTLNAQGAAANRY